MKFVNIEAVLSDFRGMKERDNSKISLDTVISILDRYPKIEFDLKDRKETK